MRRSSSATARLGTTLLAAGAALALGACSSGERGTGTGGPAGSSSATPSGPPSSSAPSGGPSASSPSLPTPSGGASSTASAGSGGGGSGPAGGPVPSGFKPSSVTFVSPTDGWVLGTAPCSHEPCTSIVRTRDGGASWVGIPAPVATLGIAQSGRDGDVAVLRFADQQNGWAGVGKLFSTHDGGAHWRPVTLPGLVGDVANIETGGGYVFAASDGCPSQGSSHCSQTTRVYASPIGKDDWQPITGTLAGGGDAGLVVHGADWWAVTSHGIAHGSGASANGVLPSPCPGPARPTLAVADAKHLDAVCSGNGAAGSAEYQLYGSTDGGQTWSKAGPTHVEPSDVSGAADNTQGVLLVAASSGNSTVLRTADDGGSFSSVLTADSGGLPWADLGFTTPSRAVVVLPGSGLYVSHDSGRTFERVSIG